MSDKDVLCGINFISMVNIFLLFTYNSTSDKPEVVLYIIGP